MNGTNGVEVATTKSTDQSSGFPNRDGETSGISKPTNLSGDDNLLTLQDCVKLMKYESVSKAANFLMSRTKYRPRIAVICGSGLGGLEAILENTEEFSYADIPNFPISTAPGHKSSLIFGSLRGKDVMIMKGRFHLYEGYPVNLCCMPIRVMKLVGIKVLIATNAAGGLNSTFERGNLMIVNDHVNFPGFAGINPLFGPNENYFGPRFFPLDDCYDHELRSMAHDVAKELNMSKMVKEGTYAVLGGPSFETPAELRLMKLLGIDAVGMSTVHEAITAKHCGMDVLAFSLITNVCVLEIKKGKKTEEEKNGLETEVMDTGKESEDLLQQFVSNIIERIPIV